MLESKVKNTRKIKRRKGGEVYNDQTPSPDLEKLNEAIEKNTEKNARISKALDVRSGEDYLKLVTNCAEKGAPLMKNGKCYFSQERDRKCHNQVPNGVFRESKFLCRYGL